MKSTTVAVVVLSSHAWASAQAQDLRCHRPPYGDTSQNYARFVAEWRPALPTGMLEHACEAKFEVVAPGGSARWDFYKYGITDQHIDATGVVQLAAEFHAAELRNESYRVISVDNFVACGPGDSPGTCGKVGRSLAAEGAKVQLSGAWYLENDGVLKLFPSGQRLTVSLFARKVGQSENAVSIVLTTDHVSNEFHQHLAICQTKQGGCSLTVFGKATMCSPNGSAPAPCVDVEDAY
jgi:hypothetical protein